MEAPGSFSEGFRTKVLPVVQAMGNIHRGIMAGKLKGQMPAHTCKCTLTCHTAEATPLHCARMAEEHLGAVPFIIVPWVGQGEGQHCPNAPTQINTMLTPRGCLMLYVSIPLDTFSMNSPLRSTARLHAYSTTSAVHGHTLLAISSMVKQQSNARVHALETGCSGSPQNGQRPLT